jgi:hypothetical protein
MLGGRGQPPTLGRRGYLFQFQPRMQSLASGLAVGRYSRGGKHARSLSSAAAKLQRRSTGTTTASLPGCDLKRLHWIVAIQVAVKVHRFWVCAPRHWSVSSDSLTVLAAAARLRPRHHSCFFAVCPQVRRHCRRCVTHSCESCSPSSTISTIGTTKMLVEVSTAHLPARNFDGLPCCAVETRADL